MAFRYGPGPILDSFPGSSAAYSLRKLSSAYTGNAIRVRRASDNAEADIGFYRYTLDETSLLNFAGTSSLQVKIWYDQSGNGRNAIQNTAASQPRIVNSGSIDTEEGKPAIIQIGSQPLVASGDIVGSSFTWFSVYRSPLGARNSHSILSSGTYGQIIDYDEGPNKTSYVRFGTAAAIQYNTGTSTSRYIRSFVFSTTNLFTDYRNGSAIYQTQGASSFNNVNITLNIGSWAGLGYNNIFQEAIFYNTERSQIRSAIEVNMNKYYNVY